MSKGEQISLPQIELLVLFLGSVFFIIPMIVTSNLVGAFTFGLVVVFYLMSEFKWLKNNFNLSNTQVSINLVFLALCGFLTFEVFFLLGLFAILPISKFYKWT
ncbi:hypothetical protein D1094_18095 [Colwellia sp. RSH04]|nr:hypothetical protein D1094_18095 [Colwellia sp. RSH04]